MRLCIHCDELFDPENHEDGCAHDTCYVGSPEFSLYKLTETLRNLKRQESMATHSLQTQLDAIKDNYTQKRMDIISDFLRNVDDSVIVNTLNLYGVTLDRELKVQSIKRVRNIMFEEYGFQPSLRWTLNFVNRYFGD